MSAEASRFYLLPTGVVHRDVRKRIADSRSLFDKCRFIAAAILSRSEIRRCTDEEYKSKGG
jgi:hypothetical protein